MVHKYQDEFGCGRNMSLEELRREFDLAIGRSGYEDLCRVEKLCQSRGELFDPVEKACSSVDMLL